MLDYQSHEVIDFVKWVREFTGKSVNVTYSMWAHCTRQDDPGVECRVWVDGIINMHYASVDMFLVHIPKIKEYLVMHKEFNQ